MGALTKILPATGLYCVAYKQEGRTGFTHRFCDSIGEAEAIITAQDKAGHTVYMAQASFKTTANRKQENVHRVRSFWMDIDCGPEKFAQDPDNSYLSQIEGVQALKTFIGEVGLPLPTITSSGNGLYAHWCLTYEVLPDQWRGVARLLKKLCTSCGFKADPSRTADMSSVLRPPGATNRKYGEKPVMVLFAAEPIEFTQFANIIRNAADQRKIEAPALETPQHSTLNDEFSSGIEGPTSSAVKVAEHCAQAARMRDTKGNIPEPEWYAHIGWMRHCEEGRELIHEWSKGHPDYDYATTERKINQHTLPPTTCHYFGQTNGPGCIGCTHTNKIKTPIVLGRTYQTVDVTITNADRVGMPCGYVKTDEGLFLEEDMVRFYAHDIYPCLVASDSTLGAETVTFRHYLPLEGWKEFTLRSGMLRDQKGFLMTLQDNHVGLDSKTECNLMTDYLQRYVNKLRAARRIVKLRSQMGWSREGDALGFVLGTTLFYKDGSTENIGLAKNVPEVVNHYTQAGSLDLWVAETTKLKGRPQLAFALLAGFASALMQFSGYEGAMISMVGESGAGKTLMSRMAQSIYGYFPELTMSQEDTKNALVSRLGIYGSLPFTIDEVSNIDPLELSDLVYRVTQGRDKARLTRGAVERANNNQWRTIAMVSSNHALIDKLGAAKSDASAEMNRVFEYRVERDPSLTKSMMTELHHTILTNYGHAGAKYIKYLTEKQDNHAENIKKYTAWVDAKINAGSEERYLSVIIAAVAYAGTIAEHLGLIQFKVAEVVEWAVGTMHDMRGNKNSMTTDSVSLLGQFLDANLSNMLVTSQSHHKSGAYIEREPRGGKLYIRYEQDTNRMYISRDAIKQFLQRNYGSYSKLRRELEHGKALVRTDGRKVLGANVDGYGGAAQYVWELDLTARLLGNEFIQLCMKPAADEDASKVIDMTQRRKKNG